VLWAFLIMVIVSKGFLYYLSNAVWKCDGDTELTTQLFYLYKVFSGVKLF
jgi:hypothetical protein